ncbi:hypothetical protein CANCADRAFT_70641 [Tortispora caseinolytica NRRL Y-17796]|uniref:Translation initiation factor 3 N-terminal domain-containing protein n=1 Tax=Tortispora caseinolytica NRRL Y-17796 TaxID=767744 RepID=A0A1E4TDB3_9ASCO|nr:hypothetical protein CANCADRAFT_70641 [Tortispora caseinolytica NRRL Y-17796]
MMRIRSGMACFNLIACTRAVPVARFSCMRTVYIRQAVPEALQGLRSNKVTLIDIEGKKLGAVAVEDTHQYYDPEIHELTVVKVGEAGQSPVVRVMEKRSVARKKKAAKPSKPKKTKQFNVSWTMAPADHKNRIKNAIQQLQKGHPVEFRFGFTGLTN